MKCLLSIFISALITLAAVSEATTPFSLQSEIDAAFRDTKLIFRGTILASTSQWLCGDEEITEDQAFEIEDAYLKHSEEHLEKFGAESNEPDAVAHQEAWSKTKLGAQFQKRIEAVNLVTIRFEESIKDDGSKLPRTFRMAWSTGILQTCSHVGVSTQVGDDVLVFLNEGWDVSLPVLGERFFKLGSITMKPSKVE